MKILLTTLLSIYTSLLSAQSKFSLALGAGPAYTTHRPENYDNGVDFIDVGNKKNAIGYTYAVDLKLEKKKINWGAQYNFREFRERINRKGYIGSYTNGVYYPQTHEYAIEGNLYHKQKAINIYAEKTLVKKDDRTFSIGFGPSLFWERNQYMSLSSGVAPYSPFDVSGSRYYMYKSNEAGVYVFLNLEKKIKNRYSVGGKFDLTYLISIGNLENMGLLTYLKVEL